MPAHFAAPLACGVERWSIKTLKDRPSLLRAQLTTVGRLVGLPRPVTLPSTRMPFERHIFTVTAAVTLDRTEADLNNHYLLRVGRRP